jgi:pyruvate,water dikinase
MEAHGHHAQGEVDIAEPRWSERPDYILDIVRSYLSGLDAIDPVASHRTLASEREALLGECLTRLAGPLKRAAFRFLHRKAAWGLAQREAIKSEAIRQMAVIRHVLQELGARLAMRGVLEQGDDVFSLTLEQLDQVLKIPPTVDVREIIEKQKTLHARNLALNPPPVIFGTFDEAAPPAIPELPGGETLAGQSVSAGKAEGPARVIMKRGEEQAVQPGEILVIPYADPGWTPYFMPAAGIVMDMGGMLSHGCIIARELGIPTVVNVGPATSLITTGRIVRVDADRGIVTILE